MLIVAGDILSFLGRLSWMYLLFDWKAERGKAAKILVFAGILCSAVYTGWGWQGTARWESSSALPFFLLLLTGLILVWSIARYRDMRFWFTVFSIHTVGYCAEACSGAASSVLGGPQTGLLLAFCFYAGGALILLHTGRRYRRVMETLDPHWSFLTMIPLCFYVTMIVQSGGRRALQCGEAQPAKAAAVFITAVFVYILVGQLFSWMLRFHRAKAETLEMEKKLSFQKNYYQLAYRDSLTGLRNRRAFDEDLQEMIRAKTPLFYASFDVNGLKHINDEKGHATGDELLRRAAEFLTGQGGDFFKAYRVGGDEFAFLASLKPPQDQGSGHAKELIEKLKQNQEQSAKADGICPYFAVGYGWLEQFDGEAEVAELMRRVDRQMYRDKERIKRERGE